MAWLETLKENLVWVAGSVTALVTIVGGLQTLYHKVFPAPAPTDTGEDKPIDEVEVLDERPVARARQAGPSLSWRAWPWALGVVAFLWLALLGTLELGLVFASGTRGPDKEKKEQDAGRGNPGQDGRATEDQKQPPSGAWQVKCPALDAPTYSMELGRGLLQVKDGKGLGTRLGNYVEKAGNRLGLRWGFNKQRVEGRLEWEGANAFRLCVEDCDDAAWVNRALTFTKEAGSIGQVGFPAPGFRAAAATAVEGQWRVKCPPFSPPQYTMQFENGALKVAARGDAFARMVGYYSARDGNLELYWAPDGQKVTGRMEWQGEYRMVLHVETSDARSWLREKLIFTRGGGGPPPPPPAPGPGA